MGLESMIEDDARVYMESLGGVLMKWVSPGNKGVPDRIACHPNCGVFVMEFKAPKRTLRKNQNSMCDKLAGAGMRVYANVSNIKKAREIIEDEVNRTGPRHVIVSGL